MTRETASKITPSLTLSEISDGQTIRLELKLSIGQKWRSDEELKRENGEKNIEQNMISQNIDRGRTNFILILKIERSSSNLSSSQRCNEDYAVN